MIKQRGGVVVCDEGHDANEELVKFNSFDVTYKLMDDYDLDKFPFQKYEDILSDEDVEKVKDWLYQASIMIYVPDEQASDDAGARRKRLYKRFERMVEQIGSVKWFLEVLDDRIRLQALSARHVIADIFQNKGLKLFMSATFGNPQPLARELGVEDYHFFSYPHPIPPENRPIYDLGVPRMTKVVLDDNPLNFQKQAMAIWYWVKQMPVEWRGVILTTSYHKITFLERYLGHSVEQAGRRLIVQGAGEKVGDLVGHFISDVRDGDIAIGTIQGWGSGIDLYGDLARWVVVAGVPHVNPTDKFAKARRQISGGIAYQNWVTYNQVMQACGRVSRGERVGEEWLTNYAALADGSAMTSLALSHYGEWFRDALVTKQTIPEKLEHVI
jgi:Rad3-related DNA helicase